MSSQATSAERAPLNQSSPFAESSTVRRGINQITDLFFHPFSSGALSRLPPKGQGMRAKSKRADRAPDSSHRNFVRDYQAINDPDVLVRVPKKVATPVKVEAKVWFANERTFISYLSMGILLSTIASGLLFGGKDSPARNFALGYAVISAGILIYGWAIFQRRLTMISARDPGSFDLLWGPLFICATLFVAILVNFVFRLQEAQKHMDVHPLSFKAAWYDAGIKGQWVQPMSP